MTACQSVKRAQTGPDGLLTTLYIWLSWMAGYLLRRETSLLLQEGNLTRAGGGPLSGTNKNECKVRVRKANVNWECQLRCKCRCNGFLSPSFHLFPPLQLLSLFLSSAHSESKKIAGKLFWFKKYAY